MQITSLQKGQLRQLLKQEPAQAPKCRIRASNDVEALERWLDEYFEKPTTYRSYKKEGERFLVWCALLGKTDLRSLDRDDIDAYIAFLKDPKPREFWCGPKGGRKKDPHDQTWYPFAGPLSQSALGTAIAILNSFMNYLLAAQYVEANPFLLVRKRPKIKDRLASLNLSVNERILDEREWQAILDALHSWPDHNDELQRRKRRLSFLLNILFFLGLRIDELAQATWANFRQINNRWWFFVRGKGDRVGKIPVNQHLLHAVMTFRHAEGLAPLPREVEEGSLIPSFTHQNSGLSARQMSNLLKELAIKAAEKFPDEPKVAQKLRRFSPHWLRHLSASRQDLAGISFTNIKQNLRHQNEQTTRLYVHAYDEDRHKDMEKLAL